MEALIVAALGSPVILWFLARFDKKNSEQHATNMEMLQTIHSKVDEVGDDVKAVRKDLYDHIAFHAHKETDDGTARRTNGGATNKVRRGKTA